MYFDQVSSSPPLLFPESFYFPTQPIACFPLFLFQNKTKLKKKYWVQYWEKEVDIESLPIYSQRLQYSFLQRNAT